MSQPSILFRINYSIRRMCTRKLVNVLACIIGIAAILLGYYLYLDRLYIVDEVLQGTTLREYTLKEKMTIRVVAPKHFKDLNQFVLQHSICQAVHEIQILWPHEQPHPEDSIFKYPHTHSKVRFVPTHGRGAWESRYPEVKVETDSVLLLDADVFIPCKSLAFSQTVWRSSREACVGFFPRFLKWRGSPRQETGGGTETRTGRSRVSLLSLSNQEAHGSYSFMLPAGMLLNTYYITGISEKTGKFESAQVKARDYVNTHPQCKDLVLPLWINYVSSRGGEATLAQFPPSSPAPPVWIDVPGLSVRNVQIDAKKLTPEESDACLSDLIDIFDLSESNFPSATFKSTIAATHWIW